MALRRYDNPASRLPCESRGPVRVLLRSDARRKRTFGWAVFGPTAFFSAPPASPLDSCFRRKGEESRTAFHAALPLPSPLNFRLGLYVLPCRWRAERCAKEVYPQIPFLTCGLAAAARCNPPVRPIPRPFLERKGRFLCLRVCQRETRPEASPPMSFSTSATRTRLKSPWMVCLRHEAATANCIALPGSP